MLTLVSHWQEPAADQLEAKSLNSLNKKLDKLQEQALSKLHDQVCSGCIGLCSRYRAHASLCPGQHFLLLEAKMVQGK